MTVVDWFVCVRLGHKPVATLTKWPPGMTSYITNCQRCGKAIEVTLPRPP